MYIGFDPSRYSDTCFFSGQGGSQIVTIGFNMFQHSDLVHDDWMIWGTP